MQKRGRAAMFHQAKAGSVQGEISPASKLARYAGLLPYVVCDRIGEILNWTDFPTVLDHTIYAARLKTSPHIRAERSRLSCGTSHRSQTRKHEAMGENDLFVLWVAWSVRFRNRYIDRFRLSQNRPPESLTQPGAYRL